MIRITKRASVPSLPDLIVESESGEYADTDLILCAQKDTPNVPVAQYQAQFIHYGEMVYQFETPEDLGKAIVAIDAESTHDAAQLWREEEVRRMARERGTLTPNDQAPAPDALVEQKVPEEEEDDVQFFKEQMEQENASTTPPVIPTEPIDTEPFIEIETPGGVLGTTTPPLPSIDFDVTTTTPAIAPDALPTDTATSTPLSPWP